MFCYHVHFSHSWKMLKSKVPRAPFSEDTKVVGMGLFLPCTILSLRRATHISSESCFPVRVVVQVVGACFRVFRTVLVDLPYTELLWRMMLRALPYGSEHCSVNSWKLLRLSLLDSHQIFKVMTQPFSLFDCH